MRNTRYDMAGAKHLQNHSNTPNVGLELLGGRFVADYDDCFGEKL